MNVNDVKELIKVLDASSLTTLKWEDQEGSISLRKESKKVVVAAESATSVPVSTATLGMSNVANAGYGATESTTSSRSAEDELEGKNVVSSPLVGTVYLAPEEGADSYVSIGDSVKKGQTLAIVEAMKLMNEIESDYDGTITEILVANGQVVEYGQPLFVVG